MAWQDIVITAGSIIFVISLIPSIIGKDKPALATCVLSVGVLCAFVIVYISLQLWFSAATTALVAISWFILAIQVALRRKRK